MVKNKGKSEFSSQTNLSTDLLSVYLTFTFLAVDAQQMLNRWRNFNMMGRATVPLCTSMVFFPTAVAGVS